MTLDDDQRRTFVEKLTKLFLFQRKMNSLVVHQSVLRADVHDLLMSEGGSQSSKTRLRNALQDPPESLVPHPAHIEAHSPVHSPAPQDQKTDVGYLGCISIFRRRGSVVFSKWEKYFIHGRYMLRKSFQFAKFINLYYIQHTAIQHSKTQKLFRAISQNILATKKQL